VGQEKEKAENVILLTTGTAVTPEALKDLVALPAVRSAQPLEL